MENRKPSADPVPRLVTNSVTEMSSEVIGAERICNPRLWKRRGKNPGFICDQIRCDSKLTVYEMAHGKLVKRAVFLLCSSAAFWESSCLWEHPLDSVGLRCLLLFWNCEWGKQPWCPSCWKVCFLLCLHVLDGAGGNQTNGAYQSLNLFIYFRCLNNKKARKSVAELN